MKQSLTIDILTLFPDMFTGVLNQSIIGKAQEKQLVSFNVVDFRQFTQDKHQRVDDYPYGGGGGMVLKPEPLFEAVDCLLERTAKQPRVILMCPQGERYTQQKAEQLAQEDHLIFVCGHYEGYDERIREHLVTDEISIGDYVLTGGELPAMVVIDSVTRLRQGVLGNEQSHQLDSYSTGLLEHPQYTRPLEYRGFKVPDVLLSGHHENIEKWRREQSLYRTWKRRPDLLAFVSLSEDEKSLIKQWENSKKD